MTNLLVVIGHWHHGIANCVDGLHEGLRRDVRVATGPRCTLQLQLQLLQLRRRMRRRHLSAAAARFRISNCKMQHPDLSRTVNVWHNEC